MAASAAAFLVWCPYMQAWRRRNPSYTSTCQVDVPRRAALSGSLTVARTVGR